MEDYKFLFKVVLVGNAGVGKTCLVRRFTQGMFPPGQGATIGVDFMIKTVEIEGEKIKVSVGGTFNSGTLITSFLLPSASDMGYGRTRALSQHNPKLLSLGACIDPCV